MLLHHAHGTLTDFRGKFIVLAHDCILSRNTASSKPGAIHFEFLLSSDVPSGVHVVPITGASGVGKSHMVRILNARLKSLNEDGRYVVIRIPKSASLRTVVKFILEKLPEDEYAQVRSEFDKALASDLNIEDTVIRFQRELDIALSQLAKELEIRVRANPRDSALKEQWGHANSLAKFMGDPELVDHFREKVFPRFVQRAMVGQQQIEDEALIKDFVPDDFLLPDSIDLSKSALQTNAYYTKILRAREGQGMRVATRLLNENMVVDKAIRQLFSLHQSLGGMTLQDVITEIRRRLLNQKRELVVFVEDFKALTGIQDILLKVLIQEGVRDGEQELATMRSVIALTDGYLSTQDTIATRAKREWKVESELSTPEEVLNRTKALVAAYLNAARWGYKELVRHFEKRRDVGTDQGRWIDPYIDPEGSIDSETLAAFGYQDDIPLFPYTKPAIEQLAKAALTRNDVLVFTPRFVIDNVLRTLLLQGRAAFERGEFPPPSLKAPLLNAEVTQWLGSLPVSDDIRERCRRFISIWGDAPRTVAEIGYIPKEVFDAFNLVRPNIEFQPAPTVSVQTVSPHTPPQPITTPKPEDDSTTEALEKWARGERMPQTIANSIRNSIASALNDRIDWVAERCMKFDIPRNAISIPNAGGEGNIVTNPIKVADDHSDPTGQIRSELAAVTRLYQLSSAKTSYSDADDDQVWVGNLVDRLMSQALMFVRSNTQRKVDAALRLLLKNSHILGLYARGMTPTSLVPVLFGDVPPPPAVPSEANPAFVEWRNLQDQARQLRPTLIQTVESLCGCFQGETGKTPYAIDMVRVTNSLKADDVAYSVEDLEFGSDVRALLKEMADTRVRVRVRKVLKEANALRTRLITELGENFKKQQVVDELKMLADELSKNGVWPTGEIGMGAIAFKNRCDEFRAMAIGEALTTLSNAGEGELEAITEQQTAWVGRLDVLPLIVADGFTDLAVKVLRAAKTQAATLEAQFQGVDPEAQASKVQELFQSLIGELESFSHEGGEGQ
ncbi:protein DpdH [Alcaligenes faecalis]|uniref:protein DpdH n=1 Tax=Alcaligenes faecalis TaxID=511 RepID=UPI002368998B|nr:protein DpdH [Alcaligenes faecalis]